MLTMHIRYNGSNTFVDLSGSMTTEGVIALGRALAEGCARHGAEGKGRCFIATDAVTLPPSADVTNHKARQWMHKLVQGMGVAPSSVYFKGRHAFALAPDGCRVIVHRPRNREDNARGAAQSRFAGGPRALCKRAAQAQTAPAAHGSHADMHDENNKKPGCTGNCDTCPRCKNKAHGH